MCASDKFAGWKLRESVRRTSDPSALESYFHMLRTSPPPRRHSWQSPYMEGEVAHAANSLTREHLETTNRLASRGRELESAWRDLLKMERIVAYGRRGSPMADQKVIPASAWDSLRVKSLKKGVLIERTKARTEIFDVRVFPAIEAPDAIDRLAGNTVIEAFEQFVFNDPQRIQVQARATAKGGDALAVSFEPLLLKAFWPSDFGTAHVWTTRIGIPHHHQSGPTLSLCQAADRVLIRRFGRLIGYLSSGKLVAQGLSKEGALITVSRALWQRDQTYLNLYNGDLVEYASDELASGPTAYRTLLRGMMLLKPEFDDRMSHVKPISVDGLPFSTTKTPSIQTGKTRSSLAKSRTAAERECAEWLAGEIRRSPDVRRFTASEHWQQARIKWPSLTERGYLTARKIAVGATGDVVWSRGGAPRKSTVRNIGS